MSKKYYAVKKGHHPGIYSTWEECQAQVTGFSGAIYKSFPSRTEAEQWLKTADHQPATKIDETSDDNVIYVFTDGGSRNHGNKRGEHVKQSDKAAWALLIMKNGQKFTSTGGEYGATNNRMELMALRNALYILIKNGKQDDQIIATLDSHYVLDPIMKGWLKGWQRRGWKTSSGTPVANQKLWSQLEQFLPQFSHLRFQWTKGHADNDGNVTVDHLLNQTMDNMEGQ